MPVTQAILKLLRQRGVPMSVEEVAEALAADYPAKDAAKLKVSARTFLSSKKSEGVLTGAQNDKGVLAYGFPRTT